MPVLRHYVRPQSEVLSSGFNCLLDLEFTFWPGSWRRGWSAPHKYGELVRCGLLDLEFSSEANKIVVTQLLEYLVRRALKPVLLEYYADLTGISNEVLARDTVSFEGIFLLISDESRIPLANGDDIETLNKDAMFHVFPFVAFHGFDLRRFLSRPLALEIADYTSSELPLLVESFWRPGPAHQALNNCWYVLQALAFGSS